MTQGKHSSRLDCSKRSKQTTPMPCMRPTPDETKQGETPTQPSDFTLSQAELSRQKEHYNDNDSDNKHTRNHTEHNKNYNSNKMSKMTDKNKKTVITIMP